ncbi:hypothetical protein F5X96DRAFT_692253 [Biscogniauxia mediterranea]|nr:hypothetical protein F5X96DRAFT_692253 [Biscogniauxia mediterranea]
MHPFITINIDLNNSNQASPRNISQDKDQFDRLEKENTMAPRIDHKKPIRSPRTNRSRKSPSPKIISGGVTPSPGGVKKKTISSSYSTNILSWLASWFVTKKIRSLSPEKAGAILSTLPTELQNFKGVEPPGSDGQGPEMDPSGCVVGCTHQFNDMLADLETAHTQLLQQVNSLHIQVANIEKRPACFCNQASSPAYADAAVPVDSTGNESSVVHELPAKAFPTSVTIACKEPLTTDVVSVNELHELPAGKLNAQELPAIEPPVYELPAIEPPVYELPAIEPAVYELPANESPVYELPANESPVYELPSNESHIHGSPTNKSLAYELHVQELPANESPAYGVPAFQYPVAQTYVKSKQFPTSAEPVHTSHGYDTPAFTIQTPPPTPLAVEQVLDDPMNFEMEDTIPLTTTGDSFGANISFDV